MASYPCSCDTLFIPDVGTQAAARITCLSNRVFQRAVRSRGNPSEVGAELDQPTDRVLVTRNSLIRIAPSQVQFGIGPTGSRRDSFDHCAFLPCVPDSVGGIPSGALRPVRKAFSVPEPVLSSYRPW